MSDFAGLFDIRDYQPKDENFILATFLRGNYYGHSWFRLVPQDIFMAQYRKVAEHFTRSGKCTIKVACLKEDPEVIIGYSILANDFQTIHWVHVKQAFRKHGIATALTPRHPTAVSHLNDLGVKLLSKFPNTIFNPFAL